MLLNLVNQFVVVVSMIVETPSLHVVGQLTINESGSSLISRAPSFDMSRAPHWKNWNVEIS